MTRLVAPKNIQGRAPLTTDDISKNYLVGYTWLNTIDNSEYICVDNTLNAAVWNLRGASLGGPRVSLGIFNLDYTYCQTIPGTEINITAFVIPPGCYISRFWANNDILFQNITNAIDVYVNFGTNLPLCNNYFPLGGMTAYNNPVNMTRAITAPYPFSMTVPTAIYAYIAYSGPGYYSFADLIQGHLQATYELTDISRIP